MPATQTIAVNLLSVVPGRVGGAEEYAVRVLSAYAQHGPADIRPVLYVLDGFQEAHPELARSFETEVCPVNGHSRSRRVLAESTWLARRTTGAAHHFGGRLPLRAGRPIAVTIHDLQPLDHPERFSKTKAAYLSWAIPRSIRRADVVIGVSDRVSERLRSGFPIDPQKVFTVSSGVAAVAQAPPASANPPTILYPAATYPHKNHLVLIEAFEKLADHHPEVRLVLTGGAGRAETQVATAVANSPHTSRIDRTGRVPENELVQRMAAATVLAFPSSYEGFGLPVLEAMALGVPVVVGADTPAADLVAEPAQMIDPTDANAWAEALALLISEPNQRHQAALQGLARAQTHLWEYSAAQLEQAWRRLLASN